MRIVIVGGGIAAVYAANAILKQKPDADVLILSNEVYSPYDRIHLCALVDESESLKHITLELNASVRVELNQEIVSINKETKRVFSANASYLYDYLIIATGSKPMTLFDIDALENAVTFRSADDSYKLV